MKPDSLFREEAIHFRHSRSGRCRLAMPPSTNILLCFVVAIVVAVASLLILGSYARKETVAGYVAPSNGSANVYPPRQGRVSSVIVRLGDQVRTGDPLFVISDDSNLLDGRLVSTEMRRGVESQIEFALEERASVVRRFERQLERLTRQARATNVEIETLSGSLELSDRQMNLAQFSVAARERLAVKKLVSEEEMRAAAGDVIHQKIERSHLERELQRLRSQLNDVELHRNEVEAERDYVVAGINTKVAGLRTMLVERRATEATSVVSPIDGVVTLVQVEVGKRAMPQSVAVTVAPDSDELEIRLFIPTRAIAFVSPGQSVKIMYDAFPYQQFGLQRGRLETVSHSSLAGREVEGLLSIHEPAFLGVVRPDKNRVSAYGSQYPIQPGMTVKVDIILKERSLIMWVIEPLLKLRG